MENTFVDIVLMHIRFGEALLYVYVNLHKLRTFEDFTNIYIVGFNRHIAL